MFHKFASIINTDSGSISFSIGNLNLFRESVEPITIDSVQVNGTEFLLQREPDMKLVFQHTSPKFGMRISRLDLRKVPNSIENMIVFTWSPEEIRVYMEVKGQAPVKGDYIKVA
jgi:hypothetical protein